MRTPPPRERLPFPISPLDDRPDLGPEAAAALAREGWGIEAEAGPLPGERDRNFGLLDKNGVRFVLKVSGSAETASRLDCQHRLVLHAKRRDPALGLPEFVPTPAGASRITRRFGGRVHYARLFRHLEGTPLSGFRRRPPALLTAIGRLVGRLGRALAGFHHSGLEVPDIPWAPRHAERVLRAAVEAVPEGGRRQLYRRLAEGALPDWTRLLALPSAPIHNDANDDNLLLVSGEPESAGPGDLALLDFGDALGAPPIVEAATAALYAACEALDPLPAAAAVLAGFARERPVSEEEADLFRAAFAVRGLVSSGVAALRREAISRDAHSRDRLPGETGPVPDPYLLTSEAGVWRVLQALDAEAPVITGARFRRAAGHDPLPGAAARRAAIRRAAAAAVPPIPLPDRLRHLDLTPSNPAVDPEAPLASLERLLAAARAAGELAIGRTGEPRFEQPETEIETGARTPEPEARTGAAHHHARNRGVRPGGNAGRGGPRRHGGAAHRGGRRPGRRRHPPPAPRGRGVGLPDPLPPPRPGLPRHARKRRSGPPGRYGRPGRGAAGKRGRPPAPRIPGAGRGPRRRRPASECARRVRAAAGALPESVAVFRPGRTRRDGGRGRRRNGGSARGAPPAPQPRLQPRLRRSDPPGPRPGRAPLRRRRTRLPGHGEQCLPCGPRPPAGRRRHRAPGGAAEHEHPLPLPPAHRLRRAARRHPSRAARGGVPHELGKRGQRPGAPDRAQPAGQPRDAGIRGGLPRQPDLADRSEPLQAGREGRRSLTALAPQAAEPRRLPGPLPGPESRLPRPGIRLRRGADRRRRAAGGKGRTGDPHGRGDPELRRADRAAARVSRRPLPRGAERRRGDRRRRGPDRIRPGGTRLLGLPRRPAGRPRHPARKPRPPAGQGARVARHRDPRQARRKRPPAGSGGDHPRVGPLVRDRNGVLQHLRGQSGVLRRRPRRPRSDPRGRARRPCGGHGRAAAGGSFRAREPLPYPRRGSGPRALSRLRDGSGPRDPRTGDRGGEAAGEPASRVPHPERHRRPGRQCHQDQAAAPLFVRRCRPIPPRARSRAEGAVLKTAPAGPSAATPAWSVVEVPPAGEHRATVIWLHGLGADGRDFLPVIPALGLPDALGLRFLFPEAPPRPVTINGGMVMRAWYDIESLSSERHANPEHLAASVAGVRALLDRERERGVPPERVALAGFSQGGAVALATAVCPGPGGAPPPPLAGVLAMSCYLPFPESAADAPPAGVPVFQAHGTFDEVVPLRLGERTRDLLLARGWGVDFRAYPMGHQVSEAEIRDLGRFLARILPAERAEA